MRKLSRCKHCGATIYWLTKISSPGKYVRVAADTDMGYGGTLVLDDKSKIVSESPPVENQLRYRRHECQVPSCT